MEPNYIIALFFGLLFFIIMWSHLSTSKKIQSANSRLLRLGTLDIEVTGIARKIKALEATIKEVNKTAGRANKKAIEAETAALSALHKASYN